MNEWCVNGQAKIDERRPVPCVLVVRSDGTWSAEVATFTLAGNVDLFLISDSGGHFCGPAEVARSRADTDPLRAFTELVGSGPLLVVAPQTAPELPEAYVEGEVVSESSALAAIGAGGGS